MRYAHHSLSPSHPPAHNTFQPAPSSAHSYEDQTVESNYSVKERIPSSSNGSVQTNRSRRLPWPISKYVHPSTFPTPYPTHPPALRTTQQKASEHSASPRARSPRASTLLGLRCTILLRPRLAGEARRWTKLLKYVLFPLCSLFICVHEAGRLLRRTCSCWVLRLLRTSSRRACRIPFGRYSRYALHTASMCCMC
jgi:hypothetical protein